MYDLSQTHRALACEAFIINWMRNGMVRLCFAVK
jgi:hypothetical protein